MLFPAAAEWEKHDFIFGGTQPTKKPGADCALRWEQPNHPPAPEPRQPSPERHRGCNRQICRSCCLSEPPMLQPFELPEPQPPELLPPQPELPE